MNSIPPPPVDALPDWVRRALDAAMACVRDPNCAKVDCFHTDGELHVVLGDRPEFLCAACFERRALGPEPAQIRPTGCLRCGRPLEVSRWPQWMGTSALVSASEEVLLVHYRVCGTCRWQVDQEPCGPFGRMTGARP
ncbi:hypothetical protein SAMN04488561_3320 [Jiangella alba]|uniref:Uncharacterized protein n=1 Tax=Jiangella alba TaxID=561176 RepID=A0A1H5MRG6_9ACTN|nr:hypothetical protein SAMN04488561_3320 [Jiangella alba]